jgi:hypothetical protein
MGAGSPEVAGETVIAAARGEGEATAVKIQDGAPL